MNEPCYWDAALDTVRCPKHGGAIGDCPTGAESLGSVTEQVVRLLTALRRITITDRPEAAQLQPPAKGQ